ncbi:hypothetical protein K2173_025130 [Erythroxylum novogranatense]|uniref:3-oxo-5-alpha-steroid 4-dehydrogenase C-terminal domain-containing protein n=1 Tax=Erythroxylum novogranatense TaxID=1862640 RepID=A0AAV8SWQ1_9ROSI|nr:hypothetical protein K2173_025130 [Erythroxylum novogranatense]
MAWLILFAPPPSIYVTVMTVVSAVSLANAGWSEVRGKHLQYSKFWNSNKKQLLNCQLSSRTGMLLIYSPAFLVGAASFWLLHAAESGSLRFMLVKSVLTIHFLKRILEVLLVHKYSGRVMVDSLILISLSYGLSTATMIYAQQLTQGFAEPPIDLMYPGMVLFLVGITVNFYHHCLLSKLRSNRDKEYKLPKGGLFGLVVCPHYLFEIIGFWGVAFVSQTLYAFSFATATTLYLIGRSYATRRWYLSKFEDFPKHIKALLPFLF